MARTTRSLADGDTTVVGFNIFLRRPGHMQFHTDVPLEVALAGLGTIDAKHDPIVVRVTTEVIGTDAASVLDMVGER